MDDLFLVDLKVSLDDLVHQWKDFFFGELSLDLFVEVA